MLIGEKDVDKVSIHHRHRLKKQSQAGGSCSTTAVRYVKADMVNRRMMHRENTPTVWIKPSMVSHAVPMPSRSFSIWEMLKPKRFYNVRPASDEVKKAFSIAKDSRGSICPFCQLGNCQFGSCCWFVFHSGSPRGLQLQKHAYYIQDHPQNVEGDPSRQMRIAPFCRSRT